jgi:hypothetical protein
MTATATLASLLQRFFTERLVAQQRASPHTIASYRDAFRLLLRFAQEQLGKAPSIWPSTISMPHSSGHS